MSQHDDDVVVVVVVVVSIAFEVPKMGSSLGPIHKCPIAHSSS